MSHLPVVGPVPIRSTTITSRHWALYCLLAGDDPDRILALALRLTHVSPQWLALFEGLVTAAEQGDALPALPSENAPAPK
jgi:hypothetical protein